MTWHGQALVTEAVARRVLGNVSRRVLHKLSEHGTVRAFTLPWTKHRRYVLVDVLRLSEHEEH